MSQAGKGAAGGLTLVALGSNATSRHGEPRQTVDAALAALDARFGCIVASQLYQTPAFPDGSGPAFVNAACVFQSQRPAAQILADLHAIEADFRRRRDVRWGPRTLDLDLIACDDQIIPDPETFTAWQTLPLAAQQTQAPDRLILPHPRLQDRPFVLIPLADALARSAARAAHPDWTHPVLHKTIPEMIAAHPPAARAEVVALT